MVGQHNTCSGYGKCKLLTLYIRVIDPRFSEWRKMTKVADEKSNVASCFMEIACLICLICLIYFCMVMMVFKLTQSQHRPLRFSQSAWITMAVSGAVHRCHRFNPHIVQQQPCNPAPASQEPLVLATRSPRFWSIWPCALFVMQLP